jgi:hypothetical protein
MPAFANSASALEIAASRWRLVREAGVAGSPLAAAVDAERFKHDAFDAALRPAPWSGNRHALLAGELGERETLFFEKTDHHVLAIGDVLNHVIAKIDDRCGRRRIRDILIPNYQENLCDKLREKPHEKTFGIKYRLCRTPLFPT